MRNSRLIKPIEYLEIGIHCYVISSDSIHHCVMPQKALLVEVYIWIILIFWTIGASLYRTILSSLYVRTQEEFPEAGYIFGMMNCEFCTIIAFMILFIIFSFILVCVKDGLNYPPFFMHNHSLYYALFHYFIFYSPYLNHVISNAHNMGSV